MYGLVCPKVHPLPPLPILSQLLLLSLWERAEKDSNSFKTEKSFNAIPTLSKTPTYLSPVCGLWKDISGLGLRGENLPSEAGLGMSYRHLRGCKSLGPDHGFSIQLQPRPGSRAQAAPPRTPSPRQGRNIGKHGKVSLILRIKRGRFWFHDSFGSHMFLQSTVMIRPNDWVVTWVFAYLIDLIPFARSLIKLQNVQYSQWTNAKSARNVNGKITRCKTQIVRATVKKD